MLVQNNYRPTRRNYNYKKKQPVSIGNSRLYFILFFFIICFSVIIFRALYFTMGDGTKWKERSFGYAEKKIDLLSNRGTIYDRNNNVLAIDITLKDIILDPYKLPDFEDQFNRAKNDTQRRLVINNKETYGEKINKLAILLSMDVKELEERLNINNYNNKKFSKGDKILKKKANNQLSNDISALKIQGIITKSTKTRHYNDKEYLSQIVGKTKRDLDQSKSKEITIGLDGAEYSFDNKLRNYDGYKTLIPDGKGGYIGQINGKEQAPQDGENIHLSIDRNLQVESTKIAKAALLEHNADRVSAVVLNAKTGEVLTMVNVHSKKSMSHRNNVAQDEYEPGSTFKPFIVAKALDNKVVEPHTTLNTLPYKVGKKIIKDIRDYPTLDITGIVVKSSNVGVSKLSSQINNDELYNYYKAIGVGVKPNSGVNGEANGKLRNVKDWKELDKAVMSYGYGLQISLLQLARAYTVITNNGKLLPITFLKVDEKPLESEQIISAETARTVRTMMQAVTAKNGTGRRGAVKNYTTGGKSGTTKKIINKSYKNNSYISSFVGFAPVANPEFIIAVNVDNPRGGEYYGGAVAAPIFSKITSKSLELFKIEPDDKENDA